MHLPLSERQRLRVLRVALLLGVLAIGCRPLGFHSRHYIITAVAGFIAAFFGPRLYRWAGAAFIVAMFVSAFQEHRAKLASEQQVRGASSRG